MSYELRNQIDVLSFECGEVSTKLLRKKASMTILTEYPVVNACLRDLGSESLTYGAARHEMIIQFLKIWGVVGLMQKLMYKGSIKILKRIRDKEMEVKKYQ